MPFMNNTFSVSRFRLEERPTDEALAMTVDVLRRFAFHPIDDLPEERSVGWTNIDDMLDTAWSVSPPDKGAYLAFALRIDTRRIPPAVLKKEIAKALKKEEAANREAGKKFISRERKREIHEQVKMRLLQRIPAVPKVVDVIWDYRQGVVYLIGASPKEQEIFAELFTRSFNTDPVPLDFYSMAALSSPDTNHLNALEPSTFTQRAAESPLGDTHDVILGQEFMSFLWYWSENGKDMGRFTRSGDKGGTFTLHMNGDVVVGDGLGARARANSGNNETDLLSEAKMGLAKGKKVIAAKMRLECDEQSWTFRLSPGFSLAALRSPSVDKNLDDEPDAVFFEKLYLLEQAWDMLDSAFAQFLSLRLNSERWKLHEGFIGTWICGCIVSDNLGLTMATHDQRVFLGTKAMEAAGHGARAVQ